MNQALIWVDLNKVTIVCWVGRPANLGRVESVRSATNFLQNEAKQVFNFLGVY